MDFFEEGYRIDSDAKADWALQEIQSKQKELDRLRVLAQEQIEEIKDKLKWEEEKFENSTKHLKMLLQDYFMHVEHKETKTQESYKLLSGSLLMKKPQQKIVCNDEESLISYLKTNNGENYIDVVEKAKWGEFKKMLTILDGNVVNKETGEVVDFIDVEEIPEKFDVKI